MAEFVKAGAEKPGDGVDHLQLLLSRCGLKKYFAPFIQNGYDTMDAVEFMTEEDMRNDCGMSPEDSRMFRSTVAEEMAAKRAYMEAMQRMEGNSAQNQQLPGPALIEAPAPVANVPAAPAIIEPPVQVGAWADAIGYESPQASPLTGAPTAEMLLLNVIASSSQSSPSAGVATAAVGSHAPVAEANAFSALPLTCLNAQVQEGQPGNVVQMFGGPQGNAFAPLQPNAFQLPQDFSSPQGNGFPLLGGPQANIVAAPPKLEEAAATPVGNSPSDSLYSLATLAQESAQYAVSAAALAAKSKDISQAMSLADAAEQAAGRARWAATTAQAYQSPLGEGDSMLASIRQVTQAAFEQALEAAESASAAIKQKEQPHKLRALAAAGGGSWTDKFGGKDEEESRGDKRSRVPCKFFEMGDCQKGLSCPLSHDAVDKEALPLWQKRAYNCTFFQDGKCIRGQACTFAHGLQELEMVKKFKAAMKDDHMRYDKRPGDWDCPKCNDRQFARNATCRKCGESRSKAAPP